MCIFAYKDAIMGRINISVGEKFGKLSVVSEDTKRVLPCGQSIRYIKCLCDCGKETSVALLHLVRSRIISCGCYQSKRGGDSNTKLFKRWKAMFERTASGAIDHHRYYVRGIRVCKEWEDWFVFRDWALSNGYSDELTIDRINNGLGYSPDNCRFVTMMENNHNRDVTRRVSYDGEVVPLIKKMRELGIDESHYGVIVGRIKRGWNEQNAVDTPIRKGNYKRNI